MHIAPVVFIPHDVGPEGWSVALISLVDCFGRHPELPLTVRAPGALLEHAVRSEPDVWARLPSERILWLAGGFSDPVLTLLPPAAEALQLSREMTAMDAAGISPGGLWVGDGWEPGLVTTATRAGLPLVFFEAALLPDLPDRPGALERAGEARLGLPVAPSLPEMKDRAEDGLVAVRSTIAGLEDLIESHHGHLMAPDQYLASHPPSHRLAPVVSSPARHPDRETFYRKLLLLVRDQGDRSTGQDLVLRLQSREYLLEAEPDRADAELVAARRSLERSRHRGDTWVQMRQVDWDADGVDEIHLETASISLVVDPTTASLEYWDDKSTGWPITAVAPAMTGLLLRRLTDDEEEPPVEGMRLEGRAEGKAHALVSLSDPGGVVCRVEVTGVTLSIELAIPETEPVRIGLEIPLSMETPRLRVDGGPWIDTGEPVAVSGHRFRLTDGERSLLISAPRPCELFLRALPGTGVVIWPHWVTVGGSYRISLSPA